MMRRSIAACVVVMTGCGALHGSGDTTSRGSSTPSSSSPGSSTAPAQTRPQSSLPSSSSVSSSPTARSSVSAAEAWEQVDSGPLSTDRFPAVLLAMGDELFVWGTSGAWVFDPTANQWRAAATPPSQLRFLDAAVWTGSEALLWGGRDASVGEPSTGAMYPTEGLAYDLAADQWRILPPAPIGPRHPAVFAWFAGEFFVWGGYRFDGPAGGSIGAPAARVLNDAAAYNPTTDTWRTLGSQVITRTDTDPSFATGSPPIQWVTVPAENSNGFAATNHLLTYDRDIDRWTQAIPSPMDGWSNAGASTSEGFIAVATSVRPNTFSAAVETAMWRPDTGWTVLPAPPVSDAVQCLTQVLHPARFAVVRRCDNLAVLEPNLTWRPLPPVAQTALVIALDTMLVAIDENVQRLKFTTNAINIP